MKKTLIERVDVGAGGAASITFSSIPQTYAGLYLVVSGRTDRAANVSDAFRITASGATGYNIKYLYGSGSGTGSYGYSNLDGLTAAAANATSNTFGNASAYIPNYTSTSTKSVSLDGVGENNATEAYQQITAGQITTTSAVTSLTLASAFGTNLLQYSSASLYGITAGSDGTTTVS